MTMFVIWLLSAILACLPLIMAAFFLMFSLPRKLEAVKQDLGKLKGWDKEPSIASRTAGRIAIQSDIDELAKRFFDKLTLSVPAVLLTLFYASAFALWSAFLGRTFANGNSWFFPSSFVTSSRPILYGFLGVYLFNLGAIVRRVYLVDLNDQVFWGAINRLWLSLGLAVVLKAQYPDSPMPVYFAIGFLANIFLQGVLDLALKAVNITKPKTEDLPLQMVKGINMWKEYRLEEEGIENVQNLATADVTELTVRTHYNFRTLVDWIDQAILLTRLTGEQVKALGSQATAISAIEFAAASPSATGSTTVSDALAETLSVDKALMANTMNTLYQDAFVQQLWYLWQIGEEGGSVPTTTVALAKAATQQG